MPEDVMKQPDGAVERGGLRHLGPRDGEDVADEHVLEVLALRRRLAHRENRRGRRDRVADADDRLLGDARAVPADRREDERAEKGEREADPVDDRRVRIAAGDREQDRDRRAERRNLRQRQIDEDDAALDDVHAEIRVDAGEDQARDERREEERQHRRVEHHFAPVFFIASTSSLMS